ITLKCGGSVHLTPMVAAIYHPDVRCFGGSFFFQAEDGIRDAQESHGLGDVYKRQISGLGIGAVYALSGVGLVVLFRATGVLNFACLLYTSDAADERASVLLGGPGIV